MSHHPDELITAYHEAGHAVMALALGRGLHRVSVKANREELGHCETKKGYLRRPPDRVEASLLIDYGGIVAESRLTGGYDRKCAEDDLRSIRERTKKRARFDRRIARLERRMLDKATYMLNQPELWRAVERIAVELLRKTTISGRAAQHLFEQAVNESARQGSAR